MRVGADGAIPWSGWGVFGTCGGVGPEHVAAPFPSQGAHPAPGRLGSPLAPAEPGSSAGRQKLGEPFQILLAAHLLGPNLPPKAAWPGTVSALPVSQGCAVLLPQNSSPAQSGASENLLDWGSVAGGEAVWRFYEGTWGDLLSKSRTSAKLAQNRPHPPVSGLVQVEVEVGAAQVGSHARSPRRGVAGGGADSGPASERSLARPPLQAPDPFRAGCAGTVGEDSVARGPPPPSPPWTGITTG